MGHTPPLPGHGLEHIVIWPWVDWWQAGTQAVGYSEKQLWGQTTVTLSSSLFLPYAAF